MRNKPHKILKFTLGAFLLCFFSTTIIAHSTHAADYKKVATYKLKHGYYTQGATMTKDYYIYSDWNKSGSTSYKRNGANIYKGGSTQIVLCKRKSNGDPGNDCKRTGTKYIDHVNYMYHVWGTDYFATETQGDYMCWSISGMLKNLNKSDGGKVSKSKCGNVISTGNLQGYGSAKQGHAEYISPTGKKYYLRAFATYCKFGAGYCDHIVLYKSNFQQEAHYDWDKHYEVEDVMVDNSTGAVYFNTNENGSTSVYKLNDNIFGKWLKPGGGGPGGSTENRTAKKSVVDKNPKVEEYHYTSQYEYDGVVETLFFGTLKEDGEGCGVYAVLDLVITIMTMGIGIAAIIGISISGIMYLTAKGNVARATKAKRRIYEIVIGLIAYAALFAVLTFLLPEWNPELKACTTLTEQEIAERDAASKAARESAAKAAAAARAKEKTPSSTQNTPTKKTTNSGNRTNAEARKEVAKIAEEFAKSKKKYLAAFETTGVKSYIKKIHDKKGYGDENNLKGKSCGAFVSTVLVTADVDAKKIRTKNFADNLLPYMQGSKKWKEVKSPQAGDVGFRWYTDHWHVYIYLNSKGKAAEASNGTSYGRIVYQNSPSHIFRYVGD